MHFSNILLGVAALAAATVHAVTINIEVGVTTTPIFSPNDVTAAVGDTVVFHFNPKNHSVTQSSFSQPCAPLAAGGFFSGFVPTPLPSTATFTITVANLKPIWFFCAQGDHCQKGMVGAINPPLVGNTLGAFEALAAATNGSVAPIGGPVGGSLFLGNSNTTGLNSTAANSTASNATINTAAAPSSITEFTGAASAIAADMFMGLAGVAVVLALL